MIKDVAVLGTSLALISAIFVFCMQVINQSFEMMERAMLHAQQGDLNALEHDVQEMNNYVKGVTFISASFLEKSNLLDEDSASYIEEVKDESSDYVETSEIEKLKEPLDRIGEVFEKIGTGEKKD